ncbi:uncharacterized protein LOC126369956 [Pectinophora gossypiella]|uniref:uncharacterized protein LOC126369956 n=1 Tax=Pectinophora gossypiella TaxID=13191 RepID=UPI00214E63A9|nr:uncharacterized protein LOC126369956 [Pectinophora gossypiella]XP_049870517.1 uncharacterized protein LOC126369956 [Pectinophora gossypiella]
MYPNGKYKVTDCEKSETDKYGVMVSVWTVDGRFKSDWNNTIVQKEFSYSEAIDLAGTGRYTIGLVATTSLALLAMSVDMFSFSTVVALASCDFYLTHAQTQVLLSIPFLGPIIMAYTWGYVSDTTGRRRSLLVGMSVSFCMSVLCAFAPNWIALAIFKLIGTCFCSCAQSVVYALLGESCSERMKGTFLLIMTSVIHLGMGSYFGLAYLIGYLEFSINLGFISFVSWRLYVLLLALPLGLSAVSLLFFYESPKFLLNVGRENEALQVLEMICKRNRGGYYPVKKVVLEEDGNVAQKTLPLLSSLWQQTAPLFRPPLLPRTVLLYCLIFIVYSTSSCLFVWLPFLANDFSRAISSSSDEHSGICYVIAQGEEAGLNNGVECTSKIGLPVVIFSVSVSLIFAFLNILMSRLAARKKTLMLVILSSSTACCFGAMYIPDNLTSLIMYFGIAADSLCMGIVFTYCVDFYPTSFRGMGTCLGVMVARISSIFGVNLVGSYITWHCARAFYALTALISSGVVLASLLPSDGVKKI